MRRACGCRFIFTRRERGAAVLIRAGREKQRASVHLLLTKKDVLVKEHKVLLSERAASRSNRCASCFARYSLDRKASNQPLNRAATAALLLQSILCLQAAAATCS